MVWSSAELGLGGVAQRGHKPKLAADLSAGIWDLDFYGEVALRFGQDIDRVRYDSSAYANLPDVPYKQPGFTPWLVQALEHRVDALYPLAPSSGVKPQAPVAFRTRSSTPPTDVFTISAEYFYNGLGYNDTAVYPGLVLPHSQTLREPATFFYLGRHYAGVFASAPAPYSWDNTTFTLSNLANLSDRSGITRFDYSFILLTHLRFEAFGAVHWGERNGEFRFGMDPSTWVRSPIPSAA